jgi:hypothetical protein
VTAEELKEVVASLDKCVALLNVAMTASLERQGRNSQGLRWNHSGDRQDQAPQPKLKKERASTRLKIASPLLTGNPKRESSATITLTTKWPRWRLSATRI